MNEIQPPYDLTPEELDRIEKRWKSDVDFKLDALLEFHEEYKPLLRLLTEREARRARLQEAIIQKSLAGLVWMFIVGIIHALWVGFKVGWTHLSQR